MNKITLALVLVIATFAQAGANPDPGGYTINVHVTGSRMVLEGRAIRPYEKLSVIIDGKKYELESYRGFDTLLALGDYKAKLIQDNPKNTYEVSQTYEFLFSDKKVRKFRVVGQTE